MIRRTFIIPNCANGYEYLPEVGQKVFCNCALWSVRRAGKVRGGIVVTLEKACAHNLPVGARPVELRRPVQEVEGFSDPNVLLSD